jgi:hypothetical protein
MELHIVREKSADEGTFGIATFNGLSWHSLELPWRGNAPNISCIPAGIYKALVEHSDRFARLIYKLQDVLARSDVEIHPANWAGNVDAGWHSDLEGCITLGMGVAELTPNVPGALAQLAVTSSGTAINQFMTATQGLPITVRIEWKDGESPEVA